MIDDRRVIAELFIEPISSIFLPEPPQRLLPSQQTGSHMGEIMVQWASVQSIGESGYFLISGYR